MARPILTLTCGIALAACLAGCNSNPRVNTTEAADKAGEPAIIKDNRIIHDEKLSRAVVLVGLAEGVTPAGLKKVEAELYNRTGSRKAIRYRFEWFGPDGLAINSAMSVWRDRALIGGERARITAIAPNNNAVDFQLEIIAAR